MRVLYFILLLILYLERGQAINIGVTVTSDSYTTIKDKISSPLLSLFPNSTLSYFFSSNYSSNFLVNNPFNDTLGSILDNIEDTLDNVENEINFSRFLSEGNITYLLNTVERSENLVTIATSRQ